MKKLSLVLGLTLSSSLFAVDHNVDISVFEYNKNLVDSVSTIAIALPRVGYDVTAHYTDKAEAFVRVGGGLGMANGDTENPNGRLTLNVNTGMGGRYKVADGVKVGGGVKYGYNVITADQEKNFHDVSIYSQLRLEGKSDKGPDYIQLEVGKSITNEAGFNAGLSIGKKF